MTAQDKTITPAKHGSIAAALASAQAQMGKALKSANNPHFKSKYADLASVVDACLPALNANGIAVVQPTTDDEHGNRYVETVLIHGDSGQDLRCRVPLIVAKNDMQGYGSAVTYARRYGLMSMAGIAPEDDDGNAAAAAAPKQEERRPAPKVAADHSQAIGYLKEADSVDELNARFKNLPEVARTAPAVIKAGADRKAQLTQPANADLGGDEIPY
jgi:hypothetical protein